jgi:hypothetical protein
LGREVSTNDWAARTDPSIRLADGYEEGELLAIQRAGSTVVVRAPQSKQQRLEDEAAQRLMKRTQPAEFHEFQREKARCIMEQFHSKLSDADLKKLEGVDFKQKGIMKCADSKQKGGENWWFVARAPIEIGCSL